MTFLDKKRNNLILFFANKESDKSIERLKLVKLIWLSDRLHLNKYGRTITKDNYKALPLGPIPSRTMDITHTGIGSFNANDLLVEDFYITAKILSNDALFSDSDLEIMEYVWKRFGKDDAFSLSDLSHFFPEWIRFERQLKNREGKCYPIDELDMFEKPKTGKVDFSDILTDDEIIFSKEEYLENKLIADMLTA